MAQARGRQWARRITWVAGTIGLVVASAYAIGGPRFFRFRARAAELLEPPTDEEMNAAIADTLSQSIAPRRLPGSEPPAILEMVAWTAIILLMVLLLLMASARWRERDR
jgi:hypothetical protein